MHNELKTAEEHNVTQDWIPATTTPEYAGEYLCHLLRLEDCGAVTSLQRVVSCSMAKWAVSYNERVTHYRALPSKPPYTAQDYFDQLIFNA